MESAYIPNRLQSRIWSTRSVFRATPMAHTTKAKQRNTVASTLEVEGTDCIYPPQHVIIR